MATQPSMKFKLTIPTFVGDKQWSMKMHLNALPPDSAAWSALFAAVWADLGLGISDQCSIDEFVGYPNDESPAVFSEPLSGFTGSCDVGSYRQTPNVCALLSWTTDARNSRGGPIYLRNFVHGTGLDGTPFDSGIDNTQQTALTTFAHKFSAAGAGYSDGSTTYHRAGPNGVVGLDGTCEDKPSRRVMARRG